MAAPLDGLQVVDLTQGYVGYAGMLLADLGATVLKVEPPEGDYLRRLGPPLLGDESAAFLGVNRGKRSVILDCRGSERARQLLFQLIRRADVLIADLYPDEAEPAGLNEQSLSRLNPGLVFCSITPFGDTGPLCNKRATELEIQGMSGMWRYLGTLGEAPVRVGVPIAAINSAIFAFQGITAALVHRTRTGQAQTVGVSQLGALLTMQTVLFVSESEPDEWIGHCLSAYRPPNRGYRTKDRAILWGFMENEEGFRRFCTELGLSQVLEDPRFQGDDARRGQQHVLQPIFEEVFKDRSADELTALVREYGGNAVPYHTFETLAGDPQALEMGIIAETSHPGIGKIRTIGLPWEFSETQPQLGRAPLLGEHTREVLAELGPSDLAVESRA